MYTQSKNVMFSENNDEVEQIKKQIQTLSLKDKLAKAKIDEKVAWCILQHFQADLGKYDEDAIKQHNNHALHCDHEHGHSDNTDSIYGTNWVELANTHTSVKQAILTHYRQYLSPQGLNTLEPATFHPTSGGFGL